MSCRYDGDGPVLCMGGQCWCLAVPAARALGDALVERLGPDGALRRLGDWKWWPCAPLWAMIEHGAEVLELDTAEIEALERDAGLWDRDGAAEEAARDTLSAASDDDMAYYEDLAAEQQDGHEWAQQGEEWPGEELDEREWDYEELALL